MYTGYYLFKFAGHVVSEVQNCTTSEALVQFFEKDFPVFLNHILKEDDRKEIIDALSSKRREFIKNEMQYDDYIKATKDEKALVRYKKISGETDKDWSYYYSVDRNYHNIQNALETISNIISKECGISFCASLVG